MKSISTRNSCITDAPENQTSTNGSSSGDDIFTSFLSAPPASSAPVSNGTSTESNSTNASAAAGKSEEESFFNQPAPTPQEKSKMTKDSILALYGTQPSQPFGGRYKSMPKMEKNARGFVDTL